MLSKHLRQMKKAGRGVGVDRSAQSTAILRGLQGRNYFSAFERLKQSAGIPMKHIHAIFQPSGINQQSQVPDGYRTHGNTA